MNIHRLRLIKSILSYDGKKSKELNFYSNIQKSSSGTPRLNILTYKQDQYS